MAIRTRLLTRADIERQFLRPVRTIDITESDSIEEIGICPVVELLELCELLKKGKLRSSLTSFQPGMQALQEGPVGRGEIVIIALDQERLADSLFERDDHLVIGLWSPAANRNVSPTHSVRRLLLRPSDQTWWDGDTYAEAEAIYGVVEELEIDTNG